jgi:hypothetical protein
MITIILICLGGFAGSLTYLYYLSKKTGEIDWEKKNGDIQ